MGTYLDWGFMETPFLTNALSPDEIGETLLIGREKELKMIKTRLSTQPNIVTIEGDNGVGKTSLVNIAVYQMYKEFKNTGRGDFCIPCYDIFQITEDTDTETFIDQVLMSVAQTLIKSVISHFNLQQLSHKNLQQNHLKRHPFFQVRWDVSFL